MTPASARFKKNTIVNLNDGYLIKPIQDLGYISDTIQLKKLLQRFNGDTTLDDDDDIDVSPMVTDEDDEMQNSQRDNSTPVFSQAECDSKVTEMLEQHP